LLTSLLLGGSLHAAEHTVLVGSPGAFDFSPSDLTIASGDTVNWVWVGGSHTVTSGTGPTAPNAGAEFDSGTRFNPPGPFSHTFNSAGDFPYYCAPHVSFGMTGIIRVSAGTPVPSMGIWAGLATALLLMAVGLWWAIPRRAGQPIRR